MTERDVALPGDTLAEVYKAWTLALAERDVALAERDHALAALDDIALMGRDGCSDDQLCRRTKLGAIAATAAALVRAEGEAL
jgi:hypothetical protein